MQSIAVIPTYDERDSIDELVARIRVSAPQLHILFVDDNSPDGSREVIRRHVQREPESIFLLQREGKEGLGKAYVAGFQKALQMGYDIILQMDADLSHDPAAIPSFLTTVESSDLVIGSRYAGGIRVVNWDFKRLILSKMATRYVQTVTGMPCTDSTSGFKCWRRRTLETIGLEAVFSEGYLFQIETTYRAYRKGLTISEIPIIFYERRFGHSKFSAAVIFEALWGVIRLRLRH